MKYLGGKMRLRKHIVPILQEHMRNIYIEPFIGSGWIFAEIDAPVMIGNDNHPDLMLMWQALLDGWVPPKEVSEEEYKSLQHAEPSALRGFVGFACSFGGKWFGGYARDSRRVRPYTTEGYGSILAKTEKMKNKNIQFLCRDYRDLDIPAKALVYADPPYNGYTQYKGNKFDSSIFWQWCRDQEALVFVSEYNAPDDFITVGSFQTKTNLKSAENKAIPRLEKLFVHEKHLSRGKDRIEKGARVYAANQ